MSDPNDKKALDQRRSDASMLRSIDKMLGIVAHKRGEVVHSKGFGDGKPQHKEVQGREKPQPKPGLGEKQPHDKQGKGDGNGQGNAEPKLNVREPGNTASKSDVQSKTGKNELRDAPRK